MSRNNDNRGGFFGCQFSMGVVVKMSVSRATVLGASLAAITVWGTPAIAQDSTEADSSDIVVTAQRQNQTQVIRGGGLGALGNKDAMDTPFAIKGYGETLIRNQQSMTLGQVLENDPSVRTSLGFGNASELFVVRGFVLAGDDIAMDGLYGITPRQLVSPELYDNVQILNGASAFLFGAAPTGTALGGTVNLQPKRATGKDINRITLNYQSDSHFGGAVDFGRRFGAGGAFGVRLNSAVRSGDTSINDEFRSSVVAGLGLDWRSDRARLSLDLAYQRAKVRHMRPTVTLLSSVTSIPEVPRADINYGQAWNYTTLRDVFGLAKFEYDLSDDFMIYASAGARDSEERGRYQSFRLKNALTGDAWLTRSNIPRDDNNEAAQAGIRGSFDTGPIKHEVNLGTSLSWFISRYAFVRSPTVEAVGSVASNSSNLYNPVQIAEPQFTAVPSGNLDNPTPASRTRLTSFFLSDTISAWDDLVQLTLGARVQKIYVRQYNVSTGAETSSYNRSATTPVVGLVIRPNEHLSFYANRIEALVQGPTAGATTINAGEVFPPYKAAQYEVGGKLAMGRYNASVALYTTDQPQTLNEVLPGGDERFTLNGLQRNKGAEFSFDGEPVDGLRIIAGLSVTEAKQRRTTRGATDGRDAIGVPAYTANANVEWDVGFLPGFTLTGRVMQTGKQAVNITNTLRLPEWTRFDLGARYVLVGAGMPVTLRFNVDNVANERYWASSLGGYLVQGLPRTFKTSASIEF